MIVKVSMLKIIVCCIVLQVPEQDWLVETCGEGYKRV